MSALNLLVLRCTDIEQSRVFYEAIEMSFVKHAHGKGPEHYAHESERMVFELYPATSTSTDELTALGFGVADLERVHLALSELKFAPSLPKETPWGRTFMVRDPDGRRVEIKPCSNSGGALK